MISEIITTNEPFFLGDLTEVSETARYLRIDRTLRDEYRARYTTRTTATVGRRAPMLAVLPGRVQHPKPEHRQGVTPTCFGEM